MAYRLICDDHIDIFQVSFINSKCKYYMYICKYTEETDTEPRIQRIHSMTVTDFNVNYYVPLVQIAYPGQGCRALEVSITSRVHRTGVPAAGPKLSVPRGQLT